MNRRIAVFMVLSFIFLFRIQVFASSLDEELQKLKQAGIPTTIEELNLPAIPDSENGALVYKEAFKLIGDLRQKYNKEFEYMPYNGTVAGGWEKTPEEWKEKIADLILHNSEFTKVYQLLEKASEMKCRFFTQDEYQRNPEKGAYNTLVNLAALRNCARILAEKALIEAESGDFNKALSASLTGLKLAKSLDYDPFLISQLIRIALDAIALNTIGKNLDKGEGSIALYQRLIEEIKRERETYLINNGLRTELVFFSLPRFSRLEKQGEKYFEFTQEDKNRIESAVLSPESAALSPEIERANEENERKYKETLKETYLKSGCKSAQAFFEKEEVLFLEMMCRVFPLTKTPYWEGKDKVKVMNDEVLKLPDEEMLIKDMFPTLLSAYLREAQVDALLGAAELGLANRIYRQKHGKFADSLNQLTPDILPSLPLDPFTGKDYIYRKKDKGFIVYSLGDNLKDDGGIPQFSEQGKKGDFDIVWEDNGAGTLVATEKSLFQCPFASCHGEFPPTPAELSPNGKAEGTWLIVWAGRLRSNGVVEGGWWELAPTGRKGRPTGDFSARAGTREGIIYVYNFVTGKTVELTGSVSMVHDRKTGKWTVSGSIVPK